VLIVIYLFIFTFVKLRY